jgi:malonyl CoA-acyl carrier protein transacylase
MTSPETTTALLFPGQGSHAVGMEEPYRDHPLLERGIELLGFDPFERLADGTRSHQPALFLCSMCQWASGDHAKPIAAAGHSLGEYAALTAAGGMVAMLGGERDDVYELAADLGLSLANDNAPGQIVLSGPMQQVDEAAARAGDIGCRGRKLDVGGAFHSPLMAPAADRLRAALDATAISDTAFPVLSNGSTEPFVDVRRELAENLLKPVRWRETLLALHAMGATDFVECGPGAVLRGLVKRTLRAAA